MTNEWFPDVAVAGHTAVAEHTVCCGGLYWVLTWYDADARSSYQIKLMDDAAGRFGSRRAAAANRTAAHQLAQVAEQLTPLGGSAGESNYDGGAATAPAAACNIHDPAAFISSAVPFIATNFDGQLVGRGPLRIEYTGIPTHPFGYPLRVVHPESSAIEFEQHWDDTGRIVTYVPSAPLDAGTTYTVDVWVKGSSQVGDQSGDEYQFTFTTAAARC